MVEDATEAVRLIPLKVKKSEPSIIMIASACAPNTVEVTVPASVLVMTGLAPVPLFWNTIGLADVPVAVIINGAVIDSV